MNDIKIPVFNGEEYGNWKRRVMAFLKMNKCELATQRLRLPMDKEPEWAEINLKAINYIYSSISNKQLEFVSECETAYDILKKFDQLYSTESTALQIVYRNRLEKLKLVDYSNTADFFNDFEKGINDLKAAGATVTEQEKLNYMLRTLPESLSYIGDLIDVLKKEQQTVEYVKGKLAMIDIKGKEESKEKMNSSAFAADSEKGKQCFKCGKTGHFIKTCPQNKNGRQDHGQLETHDMTSRGFTGQHWGYSRGRGRGGNWRGSPRSYQSGRGYQHVPGFSATGRGYRQTEARGTRRGTAVLQSGGNASFMMSENYNVTEVRDELEIIWIIDSGCTGHLINNENYFSECEELKEPVDVMLGDGRTLQASKFGQVDIIVEVEGRQMNITLTNVLYVQHLNVNLISYARITEKNEIISKGDTTKIYKPNGELVAIAYKENNLYYLRSILPRPTSQINLATSQESGTLKEKWHRILGHVNFRYLNILSKNQLLDDFPQNLEKDFMKCRICLENKMHNLPFDNKRTRAKDLLEIVHSDVNGPHRCFGYGGEKYFVSFIDDYSKLAKTYIVKSKAEVNQCFEDYINLAENKTGKRIKTLRCDNGKEYLNQEIYKLCRQKGITMSLCPSYTHELNGTAERFNRTIMDMSRCLLAEAGLNLKYWPEAVCTATYLKNRTLANTIECKTPFEIFFGIRPSAKYLKPFGSKVFVRVPEQKRSSKWDRKAELGTLVGYSDVGYRVLINNKIIVARHVDVIDEDVKFIDLKETSETKKETVTEDLIDLNDTIESDSNTESPIKSERSLDESFKSLDLGSPRDTSPQIRRSNRNKKQPERYGIDEIHNNLVYVNFINANTPTSYVEAIQDKDCIKWKEAMDHEINCLNKNNTWSLVERPEKKKVIDVKWIYTRKDENKYKARLVVRGFQQQGILDETYSPVAKTQTLKMLLSLCCQKQLFIEQMDVETAFLNGKIKSEVYVNQPDGYSDKSSRVYKLNKALYGLKESPRAWYECSNDLLIKLKFKRSNYDYCMYYFNNGTEQIYILIFVDDLLICGRNKHLIQEIKNKLAQKFSMKDMGAINNYLGISILYDPENQIMTLSQTKYIESLAQKYNLHNAKLYDTPMEINLNLEASPILDPQIKYRNIIGELLYVSIGTRPDIAFSVNYLSRYQNCYNNIHYKYALRVLKYLYKTKDLKLTYTRSKNNEILDCMVDADWAGDINDRKSTSGYVIRLFGNIIYWKSRKQKSVTKSSTFAEYVALSEAVTDILFIKNMLTETLNITIEKPIKIYEDNSGAVAIAKHGNLTKNSKHIEIQYHYVNENVEKGQIEVIKINSENNLADIFTKSIGKLSFIKHRDSLGLSF